MRAARQCAFYCVVPQASGTMFGGTREIRGCNGASQVWSTAAKSPRRSVSHGTSGGVGTGESAIRRSDRLLLDQSPETPREILVLDLAHAIATSAY